MPDHLSSPIIIIGTGRCGSTVFFEALSQHEKVGWLTNYDTVLPNSKLALLHHYLRRSKILNEWLVTEKLQNKAKRRLGQSLLIRPEEGYAKWNLLCECSFGKDYLVNQTASPKVIEQVRDFFQSLLHRQGKTKLLIKITGPSRICFLNSIFPDAKFIHIVRDPCAVASSLMRTAYWQSTLNKPRWQNGLPADWESEWEKYDQSPLALIAIQYRTIMNICHQEVAEIDNSRYLELTYHDFVESPSQTMNAALEWTNLGPSLGVTEHVGAPNRYQNMNHKYHEHFSPHEISMIREITSKQNHTKIPLHTPQMNKLTLGTAQSLFGSISFKSVLNQNEPS